MQANAEHQKDNTDLRELIGQVLIGDIAGRERPDDDTSQQITDQRRNFQPVRRYAESKGQDEADHNCGDEWCRMDHP